tara:strand:- start:896 stop:1039 length:144 start_codon:yes stop_codon:yes gene_type:complete
MTYVDILRLRVDRGELSAADAVMWLVNVGDMPLSSAWKFFADYRVQG